MAERLTPTTEFLGHGGITLDVERTLRESESRLRTLNDNLPECVASRYCLDAGGKERVEFTSAGIERLTGILRLSHERCRDGGHISLKTLNA
jgi:hypothetical protein